MNFNPEQEAHLRRAVVTTLESMPHRELVLALLAENFDAALSKLGLGVLPGTADISLGLGLLLLGLEMLPLALVVDGFRPIIRCSFGNFHVGTMTLLFRGPTDIPTP